MDVKRISVIGAGQMGSAIAQHAAINGFEVCLWGISQEESQNSIKRIAAMLEKSVSKGKIKEEEKNSALERLIPIYKLADCASSDLVIEAVIEDMQTKQSIFKELDAVCKPETIFATNTSSLSVTSIASATSRPDKVIGMHFFNPVHAMKLIEIINGYYTSEETCKTVNEVTKALGKIPVLLKKDTPGFIVNRILFAMFLEAISVYEEGIASKEDIDLALKYGLNHPMGPFELMDIGGLDTFPHVCDYLFEESKNPKWATPQSIKANYRAGRYGVKNGHGWYDYNQN
jgi:3-hydroxybutyryl-CoA dehydrogenase